ncbi:MAG: DUF4395 domain-containing protein [Gammaproteobacteria bacterium]|nr:DUF4395 domain-containing protein [candidate division Zixibacteria bacterium]NIR96492.1 DUF4395 domain-containing protein [Gammaproteobacteria bacterium]NIS48150.1 DUF4395 domain-containing protein [candidate division Zixibacteria bacterium]NIU16266.1 DUF4395 domain-containing protein [candidate division Zixibacteria bacterium]NIV08397.1 DUF4395 family protein [candidate division Zixibacteria bacterium]
MDRTKLRNVDHNALRMNQAMIILMSLIGFLLDWIWLIAILALVMVFGTIVGKPGFSPLYGIFVRFNLLNPDRIHDNPEPHRFAQGFGAGVLIISLGFLLTGFSLVGWALVWLVIALAALNLFGGFCMGCAMYYWLARLSVPGFDKQPPQDTIPGMRPRMRS